jgi:hypothetical protein
MNMNASIDTTAANTSSAKRRQLYVGIGLCAALATGIGLVEWAVATGVAQNIDWTQTAFARYLVATGAIGSFLILPGLFADANRPR